MKSPKLCDFYRQKDGSYMVYGIHGWMHCETANEMVSAIEETRSLLKGAPYEKPFVKSLVHQMA